MNLSSQLVETAQKYPNKIAYTFLEESCSYEKLNHLVDQFAVGLKDLGINKGDHVALLLGNSSHYIISLYGALRIGATVIPINPIYTADEIGYILNNGDVKVVVAVDKLLPLFEKMNEHLPHVEQIIYAEVSEEKIDSSKYSISDKLKAFSNVVEQKKVQYTPASIADDDVAIILYTSGTTGKPKGAMLTHKNVYSNAIDTATYLKLGSDDKVIAILPMFHVFCLTVALNAPLMGGGTVIIIPKFSPADVFQIAKSQQATVFAGVPTMYNFLLQSPDGKFDDFSSIRLCVSGGASMPVALLKNFEKKFNVLISEGYGLSEASPVTCFNPLDRPRKPGSIGTSIVNVENKVVNPLGHEVPRGEVGELIVNGPNVMKGYYKMPEESEAALKDGWLYTGDLAKQDEDGYFYIVDRKKDMVIVGGYNVYPREVEEVLYNHASVVEVAVLGVPDPDLGEAVKCFVVTKDNSINEEQLLEYCREHLAKYKVPSTIEFLDELPKNATGKILRRALRDQLLNK